MTTVAAVCSSTAKSMASEADVDVPLDLLCPVLHTLLRDPVVNAAGNTYERSALEQYWSTVGRSWIDPLTNDALPHRELFPNWDMRRRVQVFLDAHPDYIPEGWPDRHVPVPKRCAVQTGGAQVVWMHCVVVLLSVLVALLGITLVVVASGEGGLSWLASPSVLWNAFLVSEEKAEMPARDGLGTLFIAMIFFCAAWILEVWELCSLARLSFCITLLLSLRSVYWILLAHVMVDSFIVNVLVLAGFVLSTMIIVVATELPNFGQGVRNRRRVHGKRKQPPRLCGVGIPSACHAAASADRGSALSS
eukprot:gnl/TRDRNA2_/TRDRNA2_166551_c0_seq1.p1 gnl/TRDRNA2_/TRDRNA2_166551_c0~~gnl/TRDRNA2_/TRDRNA2_166551_c0_seq1.p1  ORF type:complete len:312 (-),score=32.11 gnl/TRDRNA2_/TRDRNA2_166551_c0_seq1:314-1228(-)